MSVDDSPERMQRLRTKVAREQTRSASKEIVEMVNYIVFLGVFLAATFYDRNDNSYATRTTYVSQLQDKPLARSSAFRSFYTMSSVRDLHDYLQGPFYDAVYRAQSFDGDTTFPPGMLYNGRGFLAGYGRIVGAIRIGQSRVDGSTCTGTLARVPSLFPVQPHDDCYPELTATTESVAPFGAPNGSVYTARTTVPSEPYFVTRSARVYGSPRYVIEIPSMERVGVCDAATTKQGCPVFDQLASLATHKFVDIATRAFFIDLTTYNPNTDEQTTVRLMVEMTKGGGFAPQVECMSYRLYRNHTSSDMVRLGLEFLVLLLVAVQLRHELHLLRRMKWAYLAMVANVAHLFSLIVFGPLMALRVMCYVHLPSPTAIDLDAFTNFRSSIWYYALADAITSFTFFLSWLKLFKFLAFLPLFAPLTKTVTKALKQVAGLILIFGVALMGSALSFTMAFGLDAENYKTVADSCLGLLKILQGELEFEELHSSNRVLGPLFFVIFVTLMFFVILNMFIVVISDAYVETKGELELMHAMHIDTLPRQMMHHLVYVRVSRLAPPLYSFRSLERLVQAPMVRAAAGAPVRPRVRHAQHGVGSSTRAGDVPQDARDDRRRACEDRALREIEMP
ncbi:hypothetical protein, variant 2 [Aphanomyces invadans]|uniref:Uncharacterized protein n=1 Tax=Aphanomyces invadans TaxID=157072 RepID=A0A024U215_9STRA|nr:hypothetical protein, variant 2 [Aphanomyces invadans]ETW00270.1 hypothetical protein, variant 2 [Aphanomyces invadans]|eukprot:XP_008871295.1 hypothetical protein, variant 2 [Aphanomyces invadans]